MPNTFTTRTDLAAYLADALDLERSAVAESISTHSHVFSNYGRISAAELAALSAAVWRDVTSTPYPEDWSRQDAAVSE